MSDLSLQIGPKRTLIGSLSPISSLGATSSRILSCAVSAMGSSPRPAISFGGETRRRIGGRAYGSGPCLLRLSAATAAAVVAVDFPFILLASRAREYFVS